MDAFEKKYRSLLNRQNKLYNELKKLKEDAANGDCKHGVTHCSSYDHDNGYGKWWKTVVKYCSICGKQLEVMYK